MSRQLLPHARAILQSLQGVNLEKPVWRAWAIFAFKTFVSPINLIIAIIFWGSVTAGPFLPPIMAASALFEVPWTLLYFYLWVFQPYRQEVSSRPPSAPHPLLTATFLLLSIALAATTIVFTYLMARLPLQALSTETSFAHPSCPVTKEDASERLCLPLDILINGCIYLSFKYIDILRFFVLCVIEYRKSEQIEDQKVRANPGFQSDDV